MPGFRCELCVVNLNSQQQYAQHLTGKAHCKRLKTKEIDGGIWNPAEVAASKPKLYGSFVPESSSKQDTNSGAPPPLPPQQQQKQQQQQQKITPQKQQVLQQATQSQTPHVTQKQQKAQQFEAAIQAARRLTELQQSPSFPTQFNQARNTEQNDTAAPKQSPPPPPPPPPPKRLVNQVVQAVVPLPPPPKSTLVNPVVQAVVDNALGVLPTKRKLYEGYCHICKLQFNSSSQESQHYQGSKHAKKAKLAQDNTLIQPASSFTCQYCNVTVNSLLQFEAHTSGTKHQANVEKCKEDQTKKLATPISTDQTKTLATPLNTDQTKKTITPTSGKDVPANTFKCQYCNIMVNSLQQFEAHTSGIKHKTNFQRFLQNQIKTERNAVTNQHMVSSV